MSVLEAIGIATVIVGSGLMTYALESVVMQNPHGPTTQRSVESRVGGAVLVMILMTVLFVTRVF